MERGPTTRSPSYHREQATRLGARRKGIVIAYSALFAGSLACFAMSAVLTKTSPTSDGNGVGTAGNGATTTVSFDEPAFVTEHRRLERLRVDGEYEGTGLSHRSHGLHLWCQSIHPRRHQLLRVGFVLYGGFVT